MKIKPLFTITFCIFLIHGSIIKSNAGILIKTDAETETLKPAKNIIYTEVAGIGGYGSLNFERIIYTKKNFTNLAIRAGISTNSLTDFTTRFNPDFIFPLAVNAYFGAKHKLEIGAGQTITNIIYANPDDDYKPGRRTNLHSNFNVGYRYQPEKGGVIFRLAYTPIIKLQQEFRHWGGISFGYAF